MCVKSNIQCYRLEGMSAGYTLRHSGDIALITRSLI